MRQRHTIDHPNRDLPVGGRLPTLLNMTRTPLFALALAVATAIAAPSLADPNPQLLDRIDRGLDDFWLETDVSQLNTAEAAQLHLILSSPEKRFFDTRRRLKAVIANSERRRLQEQRLQG